MSSGGFLFNIFAELIRAVKFLLDTSRVRENSNCFFHYKLIKIKKMPARLYQMKSFVVKIMELINAWAVISVKKLQLKMLEYIRNHFY